MLRRRGAGIVYISHRLEEIFAVSDRVTVLRDGQTVAAHETKAIDRAELIRTMVGRAMTEVFPKRPIEPGAVALELRQLSNRALGIHDVSLSVRRGEVLGVAGLVGSGRTELAETLFGLAPADGGEILLRGQPVRIDSPSQAIRLGLAYVPEDRRQHGVVLEMPVAANATLASLNAVSSKGLIDRTAERLSAESYVDRLRIKTPSVATEVGALSGGNQQKVALARWLSTGPEILILDEPTQGVDVGAKAEIHGADPGAGGARTRDRHDLVGTAGDSGHERSRGGDARRHRQRRAVARGGDPGRDPRPRAGTPARPLAPVTH